MRTLNRYYEEKWQLIPIESDGKQPMWKSWPRRQLSHSDAHEWILNRGNLAVVTGHGLVVLDYDQRIPGTITEQVDAYRKYDTCISFTPGGYHAYYKAKNKPSLRTVKQRGLDQGLESIRWENQYNLLPPSKVDSHSYWWLDSMKQELADW